MNTTNSIFEALDELNENYAAEAVTISRKNLKKPLKIAIIAAAAAVVALMVGFTTAVVKGQHNVGFTKGDSMEYFFELDLTPQNFIIPDEYMSKLDMGFLYQGYSDKHLGELMSEFNLSPLISDNFEETDQRTKVNINRYNEQDQELEFVYTLYDKNLSMEISFLARYYLDPENLTSDTHIEFPAGESTEIITLNNDSSCLVTESMAIFSYNGVRYELYLPNDETMFGIDTVKQVLADLGVL